MKVLEGSITISRCSGNSGELIHIQIRDGGSRLHFVDITMTPEEFGQAVTGLAARPVKFEVRGLENVGKTLETKNLIFPVPDSYKAKDFARDNAQSFADDGWIADTYFSSQNSIQRHDDEKYYAHGTQRRYVEAK